VSTVIFGDFEWDSLKAAGNLRKHGVSFEEASTIFADESYIIGLDLGAIGRFHAIGISAHARVITVIHIERGSRVRIISARKANRHESQTYTRRRQS
jgi:uncharacterized DUF497 family protein